MTTSRSDLASEPKGLATGTDAPDIMVFPPLVSLLAPIAAVLLEFTVPLGVLPGMGAPATTVLGVVLLLISGALAVSAARAFKAAKTNVDPRRPALYLVSAGPFRYSRNPMYLAMVILQFGLAFTFSLDWALVGGVVVFLLLHFGVVLREESYLRGKFGAAYQNYLDQTRRWL